MGLLLLLIFFAGLLTRTWRQALIVPGIVAGLNAVVQVYGAIVVVSQGPGDIWQLLGYLIGTIGINGALFLGVGFLAFGLRRLVSGPLRVDAPGRDPSSDEAA